MLWLQPGPQLIGDQSFDPFAYFEKDTKPVQVWTSSRKDFDEKFEIYSFFAVMAVLIGYVMQFIGLRGTKAWVSLSQLGVTVIMSILRGCLRMQRLGRHDNSLRTMPDMVAGHELDWLSFAIVGGGPGMGGGEKVRSGRKTQKRNGKNKNEVKVQAWHVTNLVEEAGYLETQGGGLPSRSESCTPSSKRQRETQPRGNNFLAPAKPTGGSKRGLCLELLSIRKQLAHLTGHIAFTGELEYQGWEDSKVKVRAKAVALSEAICQAAEDLWKRRRWKNQSEDSAQRDIMLRIRAVTSPGVQQTSCDEQPISIILRPPNKSQLGWRIDSAQLEAILGLWMWTIVSDERVVRKDDSHQKHSRAEGVQFARIVSAGPADRNWDREVNKQGEMDLWLGSNAVVLLEDSLTLSGQSFHGTASLWPITPGDKNYQELLPRETKYNASQMPEWRRFCGWNSIHKLPRSAASDSICMSGQQGNQQVQLRVQLTPTRGSLLDNCAQELFASLMMSLTGILTTEETTIVENAGLTQLENPTITTFAKAFVEHSLGSSSDALLCLVPAFRSQFSLPSSEVMLSALLGAAETYRKASEWDKAQNLLRWACARHALRRGEKGNSELTPDHFARALRASGELYRWSLAQHSSSVRRSFGRDGIEWMMQSYSSVNDPNVTEILGIYQSIKVGFPEDPADQYLPRGDAGRIRAYHLLVGALRDKKREEALYHLCFVNRDDFHSKHVQPALPLAVRNDWSEVVSALLEMKASPSSQDVNGRTAISYCAELGHEPYVKLLIDLGAFLDQPDEGQRTSLFWAAQSGQRNVAELLLNTGHVNVKATAEDGGTPLQLAVENGHEAVARLLLEKGAAMEAKDSEGRTPLLVAAENGHEAVFRLLLEKGAAIEARNEWMQTPLHLAVRNRHEAVVRLLLENGAAIEAMDSELHTPLYVAAESGNEVAIRLLLENSADIEAMDKRRRRPLLVAAENGHEAVAWLLLERAAAIEATDYTRQTPLQLAMKNGHEAMVRLLLEKGAATEAENSEGRTPLLVAAENGHEAMAWLLLEKGAVTEAMDREDRTPLLVAAENGHEAMARLLLEKGAAIEATDYTRQTPLHVAAKNGHEAVVRLLLEKGADIEAMDRWRRRPLHVAAKNGHEAVIRRLLEKGAAIEATDHTRQTPLHVAAENGHEAVVRLLHEKANVLHNRLPAHHLSPDLTHLSRA
jgi:ankyrin repeat protein